MLTVPGRKNPLEFLCILNWVECSLIFIDVFYKKLFVSLLCINKYFFNINNNA